MAKLSKKVYHRAGDLFFTKEKNMIVQITYGSSDIYIQAKSVGIITLLSNSMMSLLMEYDGKQVLQFSSDAQRTTALNSIIAGNVLIPITYSDGTIYMNPVLVQTINLLDNNAADFFMMDFGALIINFDSSLQRSTAIDAIIAAS